MRSAFGIEHIDKAAFGTDGDKRNTKYVAAGAGGTLAGGAIGSHIGAATAGTSNFKIAREMRSPKFAARSARVRQGATDTAAAAGHSQFGQNVAAAKAVNREAMGVRGMRASMTGLHAGYAGGLATGVGAYALHRHNKKQGSR